MKISRKKIEEIAKEVIKEQFDGEGSWDQPNATKMEMRRLIHEFPDINELLEAIRRSYGDDGDFLEQMRDVHRER